MLLLLAACVAPPARGVDSTQCDPRTLAAGEVRARQIPCGDELVDGGEGRTGDWLLENAYARYVVRGPYAALTHLGEAGGTLIDAAEPGRIDQLLEYLPDGDRGAIEAQNDDGEARLVLPGVTYRLGADDDVLHIDAVGTGVFRGRVSAARTGATVRGDEGFVGVDGRAGGVGNAVEVEGVTRAALSPEGLWPEGIDLDTAVDADTVLVQREGLDITRLPVVDGVVTGRVPADATLLGERDGCTFDGLTPTACGWLDLRVADDAGVDLVATVTDGSEAWPVPRGGGRVPVGPASRTLWVWSGPTHTAVPITWSDTVGNAIVRTVTLHRAWIPDDAVLAAPAVLVAPDAATADPPEDVAHRLASEGVGFAVLLANDEVPSVSVDPHDTILAVAGSRAAGIVWSWPWSPNSKKPAHGAIPGEAFGALDLLAVTEGGESRARLTVVDATWVARARAEAEPYDWAPRPDALWLDGLDDLPVYLGLLDAWVDITPLGPRTWIGVDADRNVPAYEAGIVDGRTTAGTGPRLGVTSLGRGHWGWAVDVRLDAPAWMGMRSVDLVTSAGTVRHTITGPGRWRWSVPPDTTWVVVVAEGERAEPASDAAAWAVSAPLWVQGTFRPEP